MQLSKHLSVKSYVLSQLNSKRFLLESWFCTDPYQTEMPVFQTTEKPRHHKKLTFAQTRNSVFLTVVNFTSNSHNVCVQLTLNSKSIQIDSRPDQYSYSDISWSQLKEQRETVSTAACCPRHTLHFNRNKKTLQFIIGGELSTFKTA